jgi:hypothetical protein
MLQRAPRPAEEKIPATSQDLLNVLWAAEHDPEINRRASYLDFKDRYAAKGIDLAKYYAQAPITLKQDEIKEAFLKKKTMNQISGTLAETLPLYANKLGRLGANIEAVVTKTAKQDDQGNSFIDFVIEVRNKWLANGAPKEFKDLPERMTFLVDTTVQEDQAIFDVKDAAFRRNLLDIGAPANVKCYETRLGDLGVTKPKVIAYQDGDQLKETGLKLGPCIVKHAGDKFTINAPEKFDTAYREYFLGLLEAIAENAKSNSIYLESLPPDAKSKERAALAAEYIKMVKFVEAYKKTPVT